MFSAASSDWYVDIMHLWVCNTNNFCELCTHVSNITNMCLLVNSKRCIAAVAIKIISPLLENDAEQ